MKILKDCLPRRRALETVRRGSVQHEPRAVAVTHGDVPIGNLRVSSHYLIKVLKFALRPELIVSLKIKRVHPILPRAAKNGYKK